MDNDSENGKVIQFPKTNFEDDFGISQTEEFADTYHGEDKDEILPRDSWDDAFQHAALHIYGFAYLTNAMQGFVAGMILTTGEFKTANWEQTRELIKAAFEMHQTWGFEK